MHSYYYFYYYTMTLEALASNELPAFLVYDTISATSSHCGDPTSSLSHLYVVPGASSPAAPQEAAVPTPLRRKRRRRTRSCKNKEEAESQRMTHIAVERNRRRQMNEHLAVLRFLMPDSYIQRGDQASIVGGAIDFVKELEQLLQSLEAQKRTLQQQKGNVEGIISVDSADSCVNGSCSSNAGGDDGEQHQHPPFAQFFTYPQYIWRHSPRDYPVMENRPAVADIEVMLIETHANLRILTQQRPRQLLKMVASLQSLRLAVLHLNVTTLESMVLYSISAKVEEGCNLTTVDAIAAAVHHILILIEAETHAALSQ